MKNLPSLLKWRSIALAVTAYLFHLFAVVTHAQPSASPGRNPMPLASALSDINFLEQAEQTALRARQFETRNAALDAAQEYERLLNNSAALPPQFTRSYEFYVVIAGARLDAARARMNYGESFKNNLNLTEQNQAKINAHLNQIPNLVMAALNVVPETDIRKFKCEAMKLLGHGQCLRGILNKSPPDLSSARAALEKVEKCDSHAAPQAREMAAYAKRLEADISKRVFRADNWAKALSKAVSLFVPRVGSHLSGLVDLSYEIYKEKHGKMPPGPR